MDSTIMFLCKYGLQILPVRLSGGGRLKDVLSSICNRWNNLSVGKFSVSYAYEDGYCALQNKSDFENMLFLFSNSDRINAKVEENEHSSRLIVGSTIDEVGDFDEVDDDDVEHVDRMDPAEKCSKHAETRYLTEAWADLIEGVGQEFPLGVKEFRAVLAKYAIENGFMYRLVKNDQLRVTAVCVVEGCGWHVHAIINRTNGVFHIKKCHNEHNCGSTYRTNKHKRVSSRLIADEIAGLVEKKPKTSPIDMLDWFTDKYGLDLCYHSAWLGVEKARGGLYGDYEGSFDRLRWYVEAARATNPGSVLRLESDPVTKEFSRLFVSFDACIKGFNYCRPFLCLDATHLKGRFKGTLLAATGKDANQCLFPIAYAICDAENDANWTWFLGLLRSTLSIRPITFITDRNAGLVNNIPVMFPGCHHAYCLYHLQFNLKDHFPGRFRQGFRNRLVELFNKCAYASSVSVYKAAEEEFYQYGGDKARTFIASVPIEHWSNAYFKGQRYGEMSSSAVESFNNWILKAREMPVFYLVDELRRKIMKQMAARRVKSMKWNSVICPKMDKKLAYFINKGRSWRIIMSKVGLYEVRCLPPKVVSLEERTCSCGKWQSTGFLCRHAVTVIIKAGGGEGSLVDHMDPLYLVDAYRRAYEEPIYPVVESDIPDFTTEGERVINPPRNRRPAGRPKVKRIRSRGEESYTRPNKCGRCHKASKHNRRTCKEPSDV
ncbi:hypothetical protein RHGRI_033980 [Rhododendron griersonianum]|uniref:SWIM-type domain-containing protein n=1 Tax=Rhododendron griersonianum TaxID=479676 RepID=A0AAV6I1V7_9ERIC|nr:hypothetical protein RHGRI_033980 [Rhododendron griersonianum]